MKFGRVNEKTGTPMIPMNLQRHAAATSGVYPCYKNQFQINTAAEGSTATMASIADCESFSVSFDNGVEEWYPFDTEGWRRALLTAKAVTITVSAKRNVGDAGNDAVAGLAWKNGRDAERDVHWTFPDGTVVKFSGAVINVTNIGAGESTNVAPLEFEIMSNGKPEITTA